MTETVPTTPTPAPTPAPATVPAWAAGVGHKADMGTSSGSGRVPFRFWLKAGTSRKILFLTDGNEAPVIEEHQYQAMKKGKLSWDNHVTCLKLLGETCPMCGFARDVDKFNAYRVQLFTILDLTPWKDRDGKERLFTKKVLAVKQRTQEMIARKYIARLDENQTLKGASFNVFRSNDSKSAAVGTEYEFLKMVDLTTLPDDAADSIDWEIFAPNKEHILEEVDRLRAAHGMTPRAGSGGSSAGASFMDVVSEPTSSGGQSSGGPIDDLETGPSDVVEVPY